MFSEICRGDGVSDDDEMLTMVNGDSGAAMAIAMENGVVGVMNGAVLETQSDNDVYNSQIRKMPANQQVAKK